MLQYLAKFVPNLSDVSAPLRKLLEGDVAWHWEAEQQKSFEKLKMLVSKAPVLRYFDVKKDITLSVDASSEGLGAVLIQDGQPVAYGSRALTDCQKRYAQIEKEPPICHDIPERAWAKVGVDLFHYEQGDYLLCVDYYSKNPEIAKLTGTTSRQVVTDLKSMFARHGIPDEVMSDNGPQFSSAEFRTFTESWEFVHTTSSPGYPQSNGQSERAIQTVKNLLKKAQESQSDPYIALLEYRNSPLEGVKLSPAQLLMGRRLKTKLPTSAQLLKPQLYDNVHHSITAVL